LNQPLVPLTNRPYASTLVGNYKPLLGSWLSRRSLRIALAPIDETGFTLVYEVLQDWMRTNPGIGPRLLSEIAGISALIDNKRISEHFGQRRVSADVLSPIGVYQLFRQSFFQVGEALGPIERTVLVAPFETVEITETTSVRRLREDSLEDFSERQTDSSQETSDSTEISEETATLTRRETKQSISASVPVMVTGAVEANAQVLDLQDKSQKEAKKFLRTVTTKASEKLIKRLTVSTKVATESSSTSSSRRLIRNDTKEPVNYGVRRLYRKDEVRIQDLGSQLAWQTYVANPGRGFAEKLQQIASPTPRKRLTVTAQVSVALAEPKRISFSFRHSVPSGYRLLHGVSIQKISSVNSGNSPVDLLSLIGWDRADARSREILSDTDIDWAWISFPISSEAVANEFAKPAKVEFSYDVEETESLTPKEVEEYLAGIRANDQEIKTRPAAQLRREELYQILRLLIESTRSESYTLNATNYEEFSLLFDTEKLFYQNSPWWWKPVFRVSGETTRLIDPTRFGLSLGWLFQPDGDVVRDEFINSEWVKVYLPIRPGQERQAIAWIQNNGQDGIPFENAAIDNTVSRLDEANKSAADKSPDEFPEGEGAPYRVIDKFEAVAPVDGFVLQTLQVG
jgi:hypothetical protein